MKVAIVGTGYVGLVTGACLAEVGSTVTCVDVDETKITQLQKGILPIYEPGLDELVERNMHTKRLSFTTRLEEALPGAEVVFIAVGTPPGADGNADLKAVLSVAERIGACMNDYLVVVTKSTVPVGTAARVRKAVQAALDARAAPYSFDMASNPEFLKEGAAIQDFLKPDRIVIGVDQPKAREILEALYQPFVLNGHPVMCMDITSAELTKYTANAMLATRISFMNDIANLCERVGADINEVRRGVGSDPRIGSKFLYAGAGYGGSCFPKDVKALISTGIAMQHPLRILEAVEAVNEDQKKVLFHKVDDYFKGQLKGKTIAIWGLAFKPNTDDMREAPSVAIIRQLLQKGAKVRVFDPVAMDSARRILDQEVVWCNDIYEAAEATDAIMLVTEWNEFRLPDWNRLGEIVHSKVIFDGRNIYNRSIVRKKGFEYFGIGQ